MLLPDEGDLCGVNGCTGTFQVMPPMDWDWGHDGCSCHISPPCGWCLAHEIRCTDCSILPSEVEIAIGPLEPMTAAMENRLSKLISRTVIDRDNDVIVGDVGLSSAPLVSLDTDDQMCHSDSTLLRITPKLHFPIMKVFEVPDEFNGAARGTHYYRTLDGVLRGPFMNFAEANFHLHRCLNR